MPGLQGSIVANISGKSSVTSYQLPLASMIRALCKAATSGPDILYEVMLKLALAIDATAQTYGLSTWTQKYGERPRINWLEGLEQDEIVEAEEAVANAFRVSDEAIQIKDGDRAICLILAATTPFREGAAIYGRCVKPLNETQAHELRVLFDVAQLAHAHVRLHGERQEHHKAALRPDAHYSALQGLDLTSRAMSRAARAFVSIQASDSTVVLAGDYVT